MMRILLIITCALTTLCVNSQTFTRSELPTSVTIPWELTMEPDDFLWMTDSGGTVSRVNPVSGDKQIVYTAPDYFAETTRFRIIHSTLEDIDIRKA